tara:strand:- start:31920 stop:33161 length:1242 start_codon:yes stop_codon:yes gene_type:complete
VSSSIDSSIEEGVRVLHLDPDRNAYETLSGFLTYWFGDYVSVRWTSSVEEAIEELNSDRIDVLITEVVLPGQGDPTVFVDRLMDEPGAADSPVIVYSDLKEDMFGVYAFRAGVAEFFPKKKTNSYLLQYRLRNLFRMQFRTKLLYRQIDDALHRFQSAHGTTQSEIKDLNDLVAEMRRELEKEYESRNKLEEEKKKIQSVFGMYVDPAIVQGIMKGDIALEQRGVEQEISILFADIRGYTTMAEQLDAEKVISFLNEYFTSMTEVLLGYEGLIDKYIGDAIMCLFGAPVYTPEHRDNAVQAAVEMQSIFDLWSSNWEQSYGISPRMGVGVASGKVTLGNVGSFQKLSYTAIGDTVNVASRLESIAKPGQVLINTDLVEGLSPEVKAKYDFKELEPVQLKGKQGLHRVWSVQFS